MILADPAFALFLLGLLQIIVVGLASWTLVTTNRLQTRITKVETLLEASMIEDVRNLKERVFKIETTCITNHYK